MSFNIRKYFTGILFLLLTTFVISDAYGEVRLPNLFTDNMIIQRNTEIPVWGYSDPNEKINIEFKDKNYTTVADHNGYWSVKLTPSKEGGPYSLIINDITLVAINAIIGGQSSINRGTVLHKRYVEKYHVMSIETLENIIYTYS